MINRDIPACNERPEPQAGAAGGVVDRWWPLLLIMGVTTLLTSAGSHGIVDWLGIRSHWGEHRIAGREWGKPLAYVAGSSLLGDALDVEQSCRALEQGMETWFVAGSSPCEWVELQPRAPDAQLTIVGISAYDMNEHYLCDFRPEVVPLQQTIRDLIRSQSSWAFAKRVVSQYPMTSMRVLFPTVGRSGGVTGGVRDHFEKVLRPGVKGNSEAGPIVADWGGMVVDPARLESIRNISASRLLRSLTKLRSACQGKHSYDGPKRIALTRMLEQAKRQGRVVVLVLPVSPAYQDEFLDVQTTGRFEAALTEMQEAVQGVHWQRLDQVKELDSNDVFWDVVHMNVHGKRIATESFLSWMRTHAAQP